METREVHSRFSLIKALGLLLVILICFAFGSCGHTRRARAPSSENLNPTRSTQRTVSLAEVLREIDAYPTPKDVDGALFERLRARLKQLIIARSNGKTISAAPGGAANTVEDLSAQADAGWNNASVSWNELLAGDYDNDGEVFIADLQPVAAYYGLTVGVHDPVKDPDDRHNLVTVKNDPDKKINDDDLIPIADNYLAHITGHQVRRAGVGHKVIIYAAVRMPQSSGRQAEPFRF